MLMFQLWLPLRTSQIPSFWSTAIASVLGTGAQSPRVCDTPGRWSWPPFYTAGSRNSSQAGDRQGLAALYVVGLKLQGRLQKGLLETVPTCLPGSAFCWRTRRSPDRQKMTHSLPFQTSGVPLGTLVSFSPPLLETATEFPSTGYSPLVLAVKWKKEKM